MSEINPLEALKALHRDLVAACERRNESLHILEQALDAHAQAFRKLLDKPPRSNKSRDVVKSGKINIDDEEYSINNEFQEMTLQLADELDLDEVESAKLLLDSEDDQLALGRPLLECGVIRFHLQRKYMLSCMRLCIQLSVDEEIEDDLKAAFEAYVNQNIYLEAAADQKVVPRCMAAMQDIRAWLQKLSDRLTTANVVYQGTVNHPPEVQEVIEYSHVSLVQQHELLAVIMCSAVSSVEKRFAVKDDFNNLLGLLQKLDRYDPLLVHYVPVIGAYVTMFGSTEGICDFHQAQELHNTICRQSDDNSWVLPHLHAAIQAWWIIEYSGMYMAMSGVSEAESEKEEKERTKLFTDALKEGAFDFILSVAADVSTPEWQDPARLGIRKWLQRQSPLLLSDLTSFSDFFHTSLMMQLEVFVEGFISNLPDVLRKLRSEEDEQRQLSQTHEQDLDLERFLLIIAYAYEGRPDAAEAFWADPDSNLAGFLQWASRRASTPLVSAFCEMLQSISENEACASQAHEFLLDDGQHASGKMRRALSLTWAQIFRELAFFVNKLREKPTPPHPNVYRGGKQTTDQAETEPETAIMLECYLRLITKLSTQSDAARIFLLDNEFQLPDVLYQLTSSPIHKRLRACAFYALKALVSRKTQGQCFKMWRMLDGWATGHYTIPPPSTRQLVAPVHQNPGDLMRKQLLELGTEFEEPNAIAQYLVSLVTPVEDLSPLQDTLPFPEELGSQVRMPGIDPYVDFVVGHAFSETSKDLTDVIQQKILRLSCLEFMLVCLDSFNENLIIIGNQTNIPVDAIIAATDLATYVRLHPFARVMEWMFNDRVLAALFDTIHSERPAEVGAAAPDSPIILSILKAVEVIIKVLDMQDTYLDLVRPLIKLQSPRKREPVANTSYTSFEDGIMNHLALVVDLGRYCGMGHPDLTLACLKLLEKVSASRKIASAWNPGRGGQTHRNKAIVALEADGEAESISGSLTAELTVPLDLAQEADSPNYMIKMYILDFLFACLQASPNEPTIAHLLLGFRCGLSVITVEQDGDFDSRTSLFHNMLRVLLESPFGDDELGMRRWLTDLKFKIMRILQILWKSPLSSSIVLNELRDNDFLFHMLLREVAIQPHLTWDGQATGTPEFLLSESSLTFISFLALRAMTFEYMSIELCAVSQGRLPNLKRRLFDALNGQMKGDDGELIPIPSVFDLFDFMTLDGLQWDFPTPQFNHYRDLDLRTCLEEDGDANAIYNVDKVKEILLLKRNEYRGSGQLVTEQVVAVIDREEAALEEYLMFSNRQKQVVSFRLRVLKSWTNVLLVMFESNEFQGSTKVSFLLQALQAILPSLEIYGSDNPDEAFELAKLAKVLLFKIDFLTGSSEDGNTHTVGNLISEKINQLFRICMDAIGKWAGNSELRAMYYSVCYRYLTGIVDKGQGFLPGRQKTIKAIQIYGERLLNVICDDAFGSDAACQTAALTLLGAFVNLGKAEEDTHVVATLNRLNFIGILVDSLKSLLGEWLEIIHTNNTEQELLWGTKLALLLNLCQTRDGATYVLGANLFRSIELSGLFSADPELEIDPSNTKALEKHYSLLVRVTRIIGAAVLARGSNNVTQGRRFLTDHRMLIMQVLKRSAGISAGRMTPALEEKVEDLADAFMVLITATGFLEFEEQQQPASQPRRAPALFH